MVTFYSQDASFNMEKYLNTIGVECVQWTDDQGMHSMTKETYDAMIAARKEAAKNVAE